MKTQEFSSLVKELKETKKFNMQSLKDCTKNQLMKLEDTLLDMELSKSLEKTLDAITNMLLNPIPVVASKKEEPEKEAKKEAKKAPKKTDKPASDVLVPMEYETLKLGDIITIYNDSIIDTNTTIVFKSNTMVVAVDLEDEVSYEFKKEFIEEGGYKFKGKNYFIRLGK